MDGSSSVIKIILVAHIISSQKVLDGGGLGRRVFIIQKVK